jgi:hypothetical protein
MSKEAHAPAKSAPHPAKAEPAPQAEPKKFFKLGEGSDA